MKRLIALTLVTLGVTLSARAQWVVFDPTAQMQSIMNTAQEIAQFVKVIQNQVQQIQYERGGFMGSIQGDVSSYVFATAAGGDFPAGRTALDNGDGNLFKHQMGALLAHVRRGEQPPRNSIDDSVKLMEAMNMLQQKGVGR